jgi:hypothetical protein
MPEDALFKAAVYAYENSVEHYSAFFAYESSWRYSEALKTSRTD